MGGLWNRYRAAVVAVLVSLLLACGMEPIQMGMGSRSDIQNGMREQRCDIISIEKTALLSMVDGLKTMHVENVKNIIENLPFKARDEGEIKRIVVHRNSLADDAKGIAKRYADEPEVAKYTGGKMPYPLVLRKDGVWEQSFELDIISPHAARFNYSGLGLAVIGDFRTEHPTKDQWIALIEMVAIARLRLFIDEAMIVGHDELPGVTKQCPGKNLDMDELRAEVGALIRAWTYERCHRAGLAL